MIAIADILQAGEKLTAVAPFLAGIQNEEQYTQALETGRSSAAQRS